MPTLDVDDGFSVHEYRHGLKLLQQDDETMTLSNKNGFECPACGEAFERLLVAETPMLTFDSPPDGPICLVRTTDRLLILTH